jgi:hypothetical protein
VNFHVGQFFTMGFFGVLVPNPEKKYEWMEECKRLVPEGELCRQPGHVTPQGLRWTR